MFSHSFFMKYAEEILTRNSSSLAYHCGISHVMAIKSKSLSGSLFWIGHNPVFLASDLCQCLGIYNFLVIHCILGMGLDFTFHVRMKSYNFLLTSCKYCIVIFKQSREKSMRQVDYWSRER